MDTPNADPPSPVSSLRKVMDPYIGGGGGAAAAAPSSASSDPRDGRNAENEKTTTTTTTTTTTNGVEGRTNTASSVNGGSKLTKLHSSRANSSHDLNPPSPAFRKGGKEDLVTKSTGAKGGQHPGALHKLDEAKGAVASPQPSPVVKSRFQESLPDIGPGPKDQAAKAVEESKEAKSRAPIAVPLSNAAASGTASVNHPAAPSAPTSPVEVAKSTESDAGKTANLDTVSGGDLPTAEDRERARKLFDSPDAASSDEPTAAWLGELDHATIRKAYIGLFDWSNMDILASLRDMCTRLILKGETQQVDRVLDAFSNRWCECNRNHGFKATGMYTYAHTHI